MVPYFDIQDPLTRADFDSRPWAKLETLLRMWLDELRVANDSGSPEATAHRRGQIAAIKDLLSLRESFLGPQQGDAAR